MKSLIDSGSYFKQIRLSFHYRVRLLFGHIHPESLKIFPLHYIVDHLHPHHLSTIIICYIVRLLVEAYSIELIIERLVWVVSVWLLLVS